MRMALLYELWLFLLFSTSPIGAQTQSCADGDVRLADGTNDLFGRVEYCYQNTWGTVCSSNWDSQDATVVCRQLGYSVEDVHTYLDGGGSGTIWLSGLLCFGSESLLQSCPAIYTLGQPPPSCTHGQDVGVSCQPNIFEVGVQNSFRMTFSVSSTTAPAVTTMVGALADIFAPYCFGAGSQLPVSPNCFETELITITGNPIRMDNLRLLRNGIANVTSVAIRSSVMMSNSVTVADFYYLIHYQNVDTVLKGGRALDIIQNNVPAFAERDISLLSVTVVFNCSLLNCFNGGTCVESVQATCVCAAGFSGEDCGINLSCSTGDVRLVNGNNHLEGRVEVCVDEMWGTVCGNNWDNLDAMVVCAQLGFRREPIMVQQFGAGTGTIRLSQVGCAGNEIRLIDCPAVAPSASMCNHDADVGVICQPLIFPMAEENYVRVTRALSFFANQMQVNAFIGALRTGFESAFMTYCNAATAQCFENDLVGRSSMSPLALTNVQNVSAIVLPGSLASDAEVMTLSMDLYYLIYYQQVETVLRADRALEILESDRTIFSALGIGDVTFSSGQLSTEATVQPTTEEPTVFCPAEDDPVWMLNYASTPAGVTVPKPCPIIPNTPIVSASTSRLCTLSGQWDPVDVSQCAREEFVSISEEAVSVFGAGEVNRDEVELLLADLVAATTPAGLGTNPVSLFPRDLGISNMVSQLTLGYLQQELISGNFVDLNTELVDVMNNVLDSSNENGWSSFREEEAGSEQLLINAEWYGAFFAIASMDDTTRQVMQENTVARRNIVFKAEPVNSSDVAAISFPEELDTVRFGAVQSTLSQEFLLERGAQGNSESLGVINIVFDNLNGFLPKDGLRNVTQPVTSIISTQVVTSNVEVINRRTGTPAQFMFTTPQFDETKNATNPLCAFWDFSSGTNSSSWSTDGVETRIMAYNESTQSYVVECLSDHLTSFAVLMDVNDALGGIDERERLALTYVTYIGCGISICCLFLTILFFIFFVRKELFTSVHYFIHLNLSIALILAYITFLAGITTAVNVRIACVVVAALLHYLFLAVFCWMLCEGVMLYLMLVVVFSNLSKKWWFFFLLGWGPPVIVVAISVGLVHEHYGNDEFCWITASDPKVGALWAFAAPMLAIILINIFFLLAALRSLYKVRRRKNNTQKADKYAGAGLFKELFLATIILLPLLGVTWVFGLLSVNQRTTVFAWIFTVCNSLQGLFIFIFHVLRSDKVCGKRRGRKSASSMRSKSSSTMKKSIKVQYSKTVTKHPTRKTTSTGEVSEDKSTTFDSHVEVDDKIVLYKEELLEDELAGLDTNLFEEVEGSGGEGGGKQKAEFKFTMIINDPPHD